MRRAIVNFGISFPPVRVQCPAFVLTYRWAEPDLIDSISLLLPAAAPFKTSTLYLTTLLLNNRLRYFRCDNVKHDTHP